MMGKTYQSIVINAPMDVVWDAISDFHDVSWAPNVIRSLERVGDRQGNEIGAQRLLNGAFTETLRSLDPDNGTFTYSIDEAPSPISSTEIDNYVGVVKVTPVTQGDGGTFVEWSSSWEGNDEEGFEFCHPIYVALLDDMKASLEK